MPVNRSATVEVRGLKELRQKLKDIDLEKDLKKVHHRVADLVAVDARQVMAGLPVGGMAGRAASTIKASRSAVGARINLGSASVPFALGVEFGAHRNVQRRRGPHSMLGWNQFQEWRGAGDGAGYAIFPTIRDNRERIMAAYMDEIDRLVRPAFPD